MDRMWPQLSNVALINDFLKVDLANCKKGYLFVMSTSNSERKKKLKVSKEDKTIYYDLKKINQYEIIPLQFGSGLYTISLWENTIGKKYQSIGILTIEVQLENKNLFMYYPNQYVNYNQDSQIVDKVNEICNGLTEKENYTIIKKYIMSNFRYNYLKASTVKSNTLLPDIDTCFKKKMGICQDLAALMVAMLRLSGIAAELVIGYADKVYHSWLITYVEGKKILFDPTAAVTKTKVAKKYEPERFY